MPREQKHKSQLTQAEMKEFKAVLLAKRDEILGNVTCMEDEAFRRQRSDLSNMPFHMADLGTDNYEVENTLGLIDSERKLIVEIDDALQRMEQGTYGICEGGGEPIPKARLEAIPWARYCVVCASLLEKGLVRRKESPQRFDYGEGDYDIQDVISDT